MSERKRKRVVLSIQQKLEIIDQLEKGKSVKALADEHNIGEQTVRDFIKKKEEFLKFTCSADSSPALKKRKTMKKSTYDDLDKAMLSWFTQQRALGNPINGLICVEKAKFFFESLGIEGKFDASNGWLYRFRQRHGICDFEIQGEAFSSDKDNGKVFSEEFNSFTLSNNLLPEQIYNVDESCLFWKCLPTETSEFEKEKSAPGYKSRKKRITIMTCSNALGTHKLKLVVIGKAKNPQLLKGTEASTMPVHYFNQTKGWMDRTIFKDWFDSKFVPQVRDFLKSKSLPEKAVLLLDNAPSHHSGTILKSDDGNIFVKYLPHNITALVQPMDQGIITSLKREYDTAVSRTFIEEDIDLQTFLKSFTLQNAIYKCSLAWEKVKRTTLIRSWKNIFPDIDEEDDFHGFSDDETSSTQNTKSANKVSKGEKVDEENIGCDNGLAAFEIFSDEDIVKRVKGEREKREGEAKEKEEPTKAPKISHSTVLNHLDCLLNYLEEQEDSLFRDKLVLYKLRSNLRKKNAKVKSKKQSPITQFFTKVV